MSKTYSIALLLLLAITSNCFSQVDTLINVGTYNLHFKVYKGAGAPILFESGGGLDLKQWDSIANILHENLHATMIIYDRQGFGSSGMDTLRYDILNEVKGLEFAISQLGYAKSDVLLVGHSVGAFYSRLYANRNPGSVKGIILFDPRTPTTYDVKFARAVAKKLVREEFSQEDIGLYYLLTKMAWNSNFIRKKTIPEAIPLLNIMAEYGPFDTKEENDRFKSAQKAFINSRRNASLLYAKSSSHNRPQDMPAYVIVEIAKFYNEYLNFNR